MRSAGCRFLIVLIWAMLTMSCSKGSFTYATTYGVTLKDGTYLKVNVEMTFTDEMGKNEINEKSDQVKRAFHMILREYRKEQLEKTGKGKVQRVLNRLGSELLKNKPESIRITDYYLGRRQ